MQRLHGISQSAMQTGAQTSEEGVSAGNYGYGLNLVLEATTNFITANSKQVERDFILTSVNASCLGLITFTVYSVMLGTSKQNWFSDFVRVETIFGDATFPHFLPGNGIFIEKGDYIVCQARNDEAVVKRIALLFQGRHI
jgi:hypothetical protein